MFNGGASDWSVGCFSWCRTSDILAGEVQGICGMMYPMDKDESVDRLSWEVITSEAVREARQPIGRDEVFAILSFERDQGVPPAIIERVIVF